jgi:hypothetical protein
MLFLNNLAGIIDPRLKNRAPTSVAPGHRPRQHAPSFKGPAIKLLICASCWSTFGTVHDRVAQQPLLVCCGHLLSGEMLPTVAER